jgi:hypothetical protein
MSSPGSIVPFEWTRRTSIEERRVLFLLPDDHQAYRKRPLKLHDHQYVLGWRERYITA